MWQEDLSWSLELLKQKRERERTARVSAVECSNARLQTTSPNSSEYLQASHSATGKITESSLNQTNTNFPT